MLHNDHYVVTFNEGTGTLTTYTPYGPTGLYTSVLYVLCYCGEAFVAARQ